MIGEALHGIWILLIQLVPLQNQAQARHGEEGGGPDSLRERSCCTRTIALGAGGAAAGAYAWLDQAWYAQYDRSPFHFFNDGDEWLQMDKTGHFFSAYMLGSWGNAAFRYCGASTAKSRWLGGSLGLAFLTGVEVLDGTSDGWGFSWWDMASNTAGAALFIGQDAVWGRQRVRPKLSAHLTDFASLRPELLGETVPDRILKDYNGLTLWISWNADLLVGEGRVPPWLNLAVGYGAEGLIEARPGSASEASAGITPYRQFYLSPDIDLTRIRTRSKAVRTVLFLASSIKVPAPAIEFSDGVWRGHWLYF